MGVLREQVGSLPGMRLVDTDVCWHIADDDELFSELRTRLPHVASLSEELRDVVPVQRQWAYGADGSVNRPERHVRAYYIDLEKLEPAGSGSIALKGTEVWADNFDTLIDRLQLTWSIFTWSLGGPERHILEDVCMMDQLERFPVAEGKPPNVHPLFDAIDEAEICSAYQRDHLRRYGDLAAVPFPLMACRFPDEVRDRVFERLAPRLSRKTKELVRNQLEAGIGAFVYYYPCVPIRVMHLQIPDASTAAGGIGFDERARLLDETVDVEAAIDGWLRTATRMLALGWLPADPASLGRGNCLMPQNLVLDGGVVDLDSLREMRTIQGRSELQFAVQKSCRVLAQSIAWFLVGTSAGLDRFEQMYSDVYGHVWRAQRALLAEEPDLPAELVQLLGGSGFARDLRDYFERAFALEQFRPGDREREQFLR